MLQVFDIDELIKPRKEAAKKKMMDEIRDETIESAISKITAAVQTQQLEATEDDDERKSGARVGDSQVKWSGMLVVSRRGVNHGFWSHIPGCSGRNATIYSRQGIF